MPVHPETYLLEAMYEYEEIYRKIILILAIYALEMAFHSAPWGVKGRGIERAFLVTPLGNLYERSSRLGERNGAILDFDPASDVYRVLPRKFTWLAWLVILFVCTFSVVVSIKYGSTFDLEESLQW